MDSFLDKNIKDIIREYPQTGLLLEQYGIGCVPCQVGTCKLGDIMEIHNLDPDTEQALLTKIARIIHPGENITFRKREQARKPAKTGSSPPIRMLMEEHKLIKRLLALVPEMVRRLELPKDKELLRMAVEFIRMYADRFHHAKEEEILFKFFDESSQIIQAMYTDHIAGRNHVKAILEAVDANDPAKAKEHLLAYRDLLSDHIRKEDEILYPWMDGKLSTAQVGKMYGDFMAVGNRFNGTEERYNRLIENFEEEFRPVAIPA
jgi:hemerythrin-like domain-containing protein